MNLLQIFFIKLEYQSKSMMTLSNFNKYLDESQVKSMHWLLRSNSIQYNYHLHKTHPPISAPMSFTMRMHLLAICSIGSTPSTLPAATASALCNTGLSLRNVCWQIWQYHSPRGILDTDAHSVHFQT